MEDPQGVIVNNELFYSCKMSQQSHFWVFIQKNSHQDLFSFSHLLQHFSQQPIGMETT